MLVGRCIGDRKPAIIVVDEHVTPWVIHFVAQVSNVFGEMGLQRLILVFLNQFDRVMIYLSKHF